MRVVIIVIIASFVGYQIYAYIYFQSKEFLQIKKEIQAYTNDCNELNDHIKDLKAIQSQVTTIDYGSGSLTDQSRYNF